MKGRWLVGVVSCAMILAMAGMVSAAGVTANSDANSPKFYRDSAQQGTPWLGVQLQDLTREVAKSMDLKVHRGALIAQVQDGSPADQAGLRNGDVITKFDGKTIHNASDLTDQIRRDRPGQEVAITVLRNGGEMKMTVRLGDVTERNRYGAGGGVGEENEPSESGTFVNPPTGENENPAEESQESPQYEQNEQNQQNQQYGQNQPYGQGEYEQGGTYGTQMGDQQMMGDQMRRMRMPTAFLGVQLQGLTDQLGDFFGIRDGRGALISRVVEDSPAAQAGLKAGDVITRIDDQDITNPEDVTRLVHNDNPGQSINITYMSDQGHSENTVTVHLARPPSGENAWMMDRETGPMFRQHMQGMQNWQNQPGMRSHMRNTYGSAEPLNRQQFHQQMQEMRSQMEQLRAQIEDLRVQMQNQQK